MRYWPGPACLARASAASALRTSVDGVAQLLQGDANTGSNSHRLAADVEVGVQQLADRVGGLQREGAINDERRHDRELIASVSRDQQSRKVRSEAARDLENHAVADRVPQTVVHRIEVVDVDDHQSASTVAGGRVLCEVLDERRALEQPGERIVPGGEECERLSLAALSPRRLPP